MKQSAAKTLGVAALGAAFAAAGAGAANAAPAAPDATQALDTVTQTVQAEQLPAAVPASDALSQGQELAGTGMAAVQPVAGKAGTGGSPTGLLGGLPVEKLPTQGVNVNGFPLGG